MDYPLIQSCTTHDDDVESCPNQGVSPALIAGVVVGTLAVIGIFAAIIWYIRRRQRTRIIGGWQKPATTSADLSLPYQAADNAVRTGNQNSDSHTTSLLASQHVASNQV